MLLNNVKQCCSLKICDPIETNIDKTNTEVRVQTAQKIQHSQKAQKYSCQENCPNISTLLANENKVLNNSKYTLPESSKDNDKQLIN